MRVSNLVKVKTLRSEKSFDKFIDQEHAVVIVYNYLCPACEQYLGEMKVYEGDISDVPIARIHMNLQWVIEKAEMIGDVEEENTFLVGRYGMGDLFPATLFFSNRELKKRVDGALHPEQLKDLIISTYQ